MVKKYFSKLLLIIFVLLSKCIPNVQSCHNPEAVDLILFNFYINPYQHQVYNVHNFHEIFNHSSFLRNRNTVIYHYGSSQTATSSPIVETIDTYLSYGNVNFVLVNYESITTNVSGNSCTIGENIAEALIRLFNSGYSPKQVHLVGFSSGSTVVAIAGREIISRSNHQHVIERITGLDPGQGREEMRLRIGDAKFTDTVHTEGVGFGDLNTRGDVQFFVNGGVVQPMCHSLIPHIAWTCSHLFVITLWNESIRTQHLSFASLQCESWEHFLHNDCNHNAPVGHIGPFTSSALRGSYFLETNLQPPYSK
ncbi:CLUMA_CG020539, isoform A [Clunio marinus]|uniref:CLUMA_CG020539, isoform A n=1 Tax=Clunio marinus TaxID=568069 RepID=A0A1J1J7X1_9DIPT|nr:CLUMA_CG020539, isoform A [Clunio marinus]